MQTTLGRNDLITETRARAIGGIVLICRELRLRLRLPDEIEVNAPPARVTYLKKTWDTLNLSLIYFPKEKRLPKSVSIVP